MSEIIDFDSTPEKTPCVYFHYYPHSNGAGVPHIKVGRANRYLKRKGNHKTKKHQVQADFSVLCVVRGNKTCEDQIKRVFKDYRIDPNGSDEEFEVRPEVVDYIRWLRDQNYVWVPPEDDKNRLCIPLEQLALVDSSIWMPNETNSKPPTKSRGLLNKTFHGDLDLPPREVMADDFYTNPIVTNMAKKVMGSIDLDPASHVVANARIKADQIYTLNDKGEKLPWFGNVWLNPPFGDWPDFAKKAADELNNGNVLQMCFLCHSRAINNKYLDCLKDISSAVCMVYGRIQYWGSRAKNANYGTSVFYVGDRKKRFAKLFREIGHTWINYDALRKNNAK